MANILLISKTKTTNLGNVALTSEVFNLYRRELPANDSLVCVGRPAGLNLVDFEKLTVKGDENKIFDNWLRRIKKETDQLKERWEEKGDVEAIKFVDTNPGSLRYNTKLDPIKKIIKGILRPALTKDYLSRVRLLKAADVVIYSGAGEVADDSVFLRQLVELALAQSFGARTYAINQSINLRDSRMINLIRRVYGRMDMIVVRGHVSKSRLIDWGIDPGKIHVCPDTAILTKPRKLAQENSRKVGVNFTPFNRFSVDVMRDMIKYLRAQGYEVLFISNNVYGDQGIIKQFKDEFDVNPMEYSSDYLNFSERLSDLAFVISSRLHTNVMALAAQVPVIPIEGHFFKTKEMFELFGYQIPVIDKNIAGWETEIVDKVKYLEQNYDQVREQIVKSLTKWRQFAEQNFTVIRDNFIQK